MKNAFDLLGDDGADASVIAAKLASQRAEAQKTIQSTMGGLNDNSAFDAFERMTEKVEQTEAEAEAAVDIGRQLSGADLEDKFKALESNSGVDDAMAALKAKMGLAPAPSIKAPAALGHDEDDFPIPDIGIDVEAESKVRS